MAQILAGLSIVTLLTAYFTSSNEYGFDILISHRRLEDVGIVLGAAYLLYATLQLVVAIVVK